MGNNVTQYKPGQFVKVNLPGRYRMASSDVIDTCGNCDISKECDKRMVGIHSSRDLFKNNKSCVETIGWKGYIVKVK